MYSQAEYKKESLFTYLICQTAVRMVRVGMALMVQNL